MTAAEKHSRRIGIEKWQPHSSVMLSARLLVGMGARFRASGPTIWPRSRSRPSSRVTPASTGRRSTTSSMAAPIRPARTIETSRGWPCCSRACRTPFLASQSIGFARPVLRPPLWRRGPFIREADLIVAGGVESMSRAPFVMGKTAKPFSREAKLEDTTIGWRFVNPAMRARYGVELDARNRGECREGFFGFARRSGRICCEKPTAGGKARLAGFLAEEIAPVLSASQGRRADRCERRRTAASQARRLKPCPSSRALSGPTGPSLRATPRR